MRIRTSFPILQRCHSFIAALFGIVVALAAFPAAAQNNAPLDTSFDIDSRVDIKFVAGGTDDATVMLNYPGRRYLVISRCGSGNTAKPCIARLNEDGSADTSFGSSGLVAMQLIAGQNMSSSAIAVQPDGKILVAGTCTPNAGPGQPCHARLLVNGQIDSSYGSSGGVVTLFGATATSTANGIAVQSDGKIVVSGACNDNSVSFCARRYLATGALDTTYGGGNGIARVVIGVTSFGVAGMLMAADNTMIMYGNCSTGSGINSVCLVRFDANGLRDPAYMAGINPPLLAHYTTGSGILEGVQQAVLQPDGRIVLAGYCVSGSTLRICAARLTAAGALDTSFAGSGWSVPTHSAFGAQSLGSGIALQRDGKVVLTAGCISRYYVCTLRLNVDGNLDTGYGSGGVMTVTSVGSYATNVAGALLDADERLLIAGGCYGNDGGGITDSCVWRLQRFAGRICSFDVDDDGIALGPTDVVLLTRAALGFRDTAAVAGISFGGNAHRTSWAPIRDYLFNQCGMTQLRP